MSGLIPEFENPEDHPFHYIKDKDQRAFLLAYSILGIQTHACDAAGLRQGAQYAWVNDPDFQRAKKVARKMSVSRLEDVTRIRAQEGVAKYKFDRHGQPLRHPENCVCGHHIREHIRRSPESVRGHESSYGSGQPIYFCPGEDPDDPDASTFYGEPYKEHKYSDNLARFLLESLDRETFGKSIDIRSRVMNIDFTKLPTPILSRIVDGESPMQVVMEYLESDQFQQLLESGDPNEILQEDDDEEG